MDKTKDRNLWKQLQPPHGTSWVLQVLLAHGQTQLESGSSWITFAGRAKHGDAKWKKTQKCDLPH